MRTGLLLVFSGAALTLILGTEVQAKLVTKTVEYQQNGTVCKGYLAYDDALKGKRPGVLVVPEWWGLERLRPAKGGTVGRAGLRGPGRRHVRQRPVTKDPKEAARLAGELRGNKPLLRARAQAALKALAANSAGGPQAPGGHRLLLRGHHGPGTGLLRGRPQGRGELPRRPDLAPAGGTQGHQGRDPGAPRGR